MAYAVDGDRKHLRSLVSGHIGAAHAFAARYHTLRHDRDDLVQEAATGLMLAAERWDPDRGVRFLTYASWWMKCSITAWLLRTSGLVNIAKSHHRQKAFWGMARAYRELGADANEDSVAALLGVSREVLSEVAMNQSRGGRFQQLDAKICFRSGPGDRGLPVYEMVPNGLPSPEEELGDVEEHEWCLTEARLAISELPPRLRRIMHLLYERGMNARQVGERLGVTREYIRQLKEKALGMVRASVHARSGSASGRL